MTASATRNGNSDGASGLTPLAQGLKNDRPEDTRSCPHDCHGSLTLTDNDNAICGSCRCTPDGVYLPPKEGESDSIEPWCTQYQWFYPKGQQGEDTEAERDRYDNSGLVRLPGGQENLYNEEDDIRPNGVTDEYTFDLSTL